MTTTTTLRLVGDLANASTRLLNADPNGGTPYDEARLQLEEDGTLTLDITTIYGAGQAVPASEYYGTVRTYTVARGACELDVARLRAACQPGGEVYPLLTRVLAGFTTDYDPSGNLRPHLTEDAQDAECDLDALDPRDWQTDRAVWDAGVWLMGNDSHEDKAHDLARAYGLAADSTDERLAEIERSLEGIAERDGFVLTGSMERDLREMREVLRAEAEDEEAE